MQNKENQNPDYDPNQIELEPMLYGKHVEVESFSDLANQRATTIPALFNTVYKFIQNPSSVSVETYKRMLDTDDTLGSGIDFLVTCLASRLGVYTHKNKEVAEWVNLVLSKIEGGWYNVVSEILSGTWVGFSVSEKIWKNDNQLGFIPYKVVTLPPTSIMFETDRVGELTEDGILQYQRNWNPTSQGMGAYYGGLVGYGYGFLPNNSRPDPYAKYGDMPFPLRVNNSWNYLSIRIPKQKCITYAHNSQGRFGNPYGRSLLRRVYKYYVVKDAVLQMLATALDRKGTPLMVVYTDPNTTLLDENKLQGSGNQKGKRVGMRADIAAKEAFKNVHNDSVVILPGKKGEIFDIDMMNQSPNEQSFISTLDFCNKSMLRGLLIPSLIFSNDNGSGSYSLGQEHSKTFVKILDGMLKGIEDTLIQQLVKEMIQYNFPQDYYSTLGFGQFEHSDFEDEDLEQVTNIWDKAITNGVIDTNDLTDLNHMREKLGLLPRDKIIEKAQPNLEALFGQNNIQNKEQENGDNEGNI